MPRLACLLLLVVPALGCTTNPYTGRSQLILVSEADEISLGRQFYAEALSEERLSTDPREVRPVTRVGGRIAAVANKPEYEWEFRVIVDDETINAWCAPGGKIAVYTGLFPVAKDEAGLAFVMGHEISHALLRHGAEQLSHEQLTGALGEVVASGLGGEDAGQQEAVLACFGLATNIAYALPFSRKQESEADRLGIELMARAGYDPRQAVETWKRMTTASGGGPPEFLSTHPSDERRIRDLGKRLPGVIPIYEAAQKAPVEMLPPTRGRKGTPKEGGD